ncbi:hypothetical protein [Streptomyces sp. ME19-01-6]|uniref:hypothetical protein n=1 Tax=Streptomyces sp. ME19-01-6 TaxID=3028686 RepID=UPI0029BBFBE5|nr:hypothetical protein [Streptomyces sp. ME19-01-6]MDX3232490.1 hypothetical protein [Streptomyces sp. ME19-01-6]
MDTTERTYADVMADLSALRAELSSVMADVREEYGADETGGYRNMIRYVAALTGATVPAAPATPARRSVRTAVRAAWERMSAPFRRTPAPTYA